MRRFHDHLLMPLLAGCLLLAATCAAGDAADLEELSRQWLAVRQELAAAEADWQHEQATLEAEASLVSGQRDALAKEVATLESATRDAAAQAAAAKAREAAARAQLQQLLAPARSAAELLRSQLAITPPALQPALRQLITGLPDPIGVDQLEAAFPALLDGLTLLLELNRDLRVEREILPVSGGTEREMDVLYVGRTIGFAVSMDDKTAAVGRPEGDRWVWTWQDNLAWRVRRAIVINRRQANARTVELPLAVGSGKEAP